MKPPPGLVKLAVWAAVIAGGSVGGALAQAPGAPTISSTSATANTITVNWTAPADSGITSYDLRYIESSAGDKADNNWTLLTAVWRSGDGDLAHTLADLEDGVGFDFQVRAFTTESGAWSATSARSTLDHSSSRASATQLTVGSSLPGRLGSSSDRDVFQFTVDMSGTYWIYTLGDLDSRGELHNSSGIRLYIQSSESLFPDGSRGFSIAASLSPGDYFVSVLRETPSPSSSYRLFVSRRGDHGNTASTATTLSVGSQVIGRIDPPDRSDPNNVVTDSELFTFVLTETTDIWMITLGGADTNGELLNSSLSVLKSTDDGWLPFEPYGFMIRRSLGAGTYYIRVTGFNNPDDDDYSFGTYQLFLRTATAGSASSASPIDISFFKSHTGHVSTTRQNEYYRLSLAADTYLGIRLLNFGENFPLDLTITDSDNVAQSFYRIPHSRWVARRSSRGSVSDQAFLKLAAGDYTVKVSIPTAGSGGRYLLYSYASSNPLSQERTCTGRPTSFSDPWFGCQWHLHNTGQFSGTNGRQDINVIELWDDSDETTMGGGITIGVVDDGLDFNHVDLKDNVDNTKHHDFSVNSVGVDDPFESHGTAVAGVIAARDNDLGVRGVAPRATLYGANVITGANNDNDEGELTLRDAATAAGLHRSDTAIQNNSWGWPDVRAPRRVNAAWESAVETGLQQGFVVNGTAKGTVYVWSAGNGHVSGSYSNLGGYESHYGVVTVCSVGYDDLRSVYSEHGSNLWLCAPSDDVTGPGIATTDNSGSYVPGLYRNSFGGTSAAAPIVSGVVALIRAANNELTWRDVKLILAASARVNDTLNRGWLAGASKYGASGAYRYNHEYGFGVVDAGAAVALARNWTNVPTVLRKSESEYSSPDPGTTVPDRESRTSSIRSLQVRLPIDSYVEFIEFVELHIEVEHDSFRDLSIALYSPAGRISGLTPAITATPGSGANTTKVKYELSGEYRLGSARHLGESAAGVWTLQIADFVPEDAGQFMSARLVVYGHGSAPGYPTVDSASPGTGALTVDWSAPSESAAPRSAATTSAIAAAMVAT